MKNEWPLSYQLWQLLGEETKREKAVEEALTTLEKLGYKGIEFRRFDFKTTAEAQAIVSKAKDHGLEISETKHTHDFVSLDEKGRKEAIIDTQKTIRMAAEVGIDKLQVFTGPGLRPHSIHLRKDISEGKAWEYVYEVFDQILPVAETAGVYINVEPVFNMLVRDYYTMMELLNHYDSKYLAVNFDTGNSNFYENDLPWTIKRLGDKIKHTHLHDSSGVGGLRSELKWDISYGLIGQGSVDWKGVFAALKEIGYKGFLGVEFGGAFLEVGLTFEQIARLWKISIEKQIEAI